MDDSRSQMPNSTTTPAELSFIACLWSRYTGSKEIKLPWQFLSWPWPQRAQSRPWTNLPCWPWPSSAETWKEPNIIWHLKFMPPKSTHDISGLCRSPADQAQGSFFRGNKLSFVWQALATIWEQTKPRITRARTGARSATWFLKFLD